MREMVNSTSVMELWAEKERKKEKEAKKRMRQEEEGDEIPKGSKAIERSPRKRAASESEVERGKKKVITMLIELKKNLKQEIAGLRKEVREIKEEWKKRMEGLEKRIDTMEKKMEEIERATINRPKEEDEERVARITNLVTETILRIGRTETGKKHHRDVLYSHL